jgi:hypothetical protein
MLAVLMRWLSGTVGIDTGCAGTLTPGQQPAASARTGTAAGVPGSERAHATTAAADTPAVAATAPGVAGTMSAQPIGRGHEAATIGAGGAFSTSNSVAADAFTDGGALTPPPRTGVTGTKSTTRPSSAVPPARGTALPSGSTSRTNSSPNGANTDGAGGGSNNARAAIAGAAAAARRRECGASGTTGGGGGSVPLEIGIEIAAERATARFALPRPTVVSDSWRRSRSSCGRAGGQAGGLCYPRHIHTRACGAHARTSRTRASRL